MAVEKTRAHRWLLVIAAALLSVAAAVPASAAAAQHAPAAAAQHASAAINASHPPGYKIVHAGPFDASPGAFDSGASVACPAGTVVWGGGVVFLGGTTASLNVNTSQPTGSSGWEARVNNSGTTDAQFAVNAICANQPAGYKLVVKTVDNPPDTQSHASVTCPSPKVLLGGGTLSSADQVTGFLTSAWPQSSAKFTGYMFNGTATDQSFTVEAICGHKPAGYKVATNGALVEAGFTLSDGIACPTGTSVLSGGAQDPDHVPVVQVAGSINEGTTAWTINVNNLGQSAHQVNGYAICAA
jgi:hypothetical protein